MPIPGSFIVNWGMTQLLVRTRTLHCAPGTVRQMIQQLSGVIQSRPAAPGDLRLGLPLENAGEPQDARSAFGQRFATGREFRPCPPSFAESSGTMPRFWSLAAFPQSSDEYYQKQAFALTTRLMSAIDFATTIPQLALTCLAWNVRSCSCTQRPVIS
jgi:hypothetical protein